jgi:hypothetical protein
MTYTHTCGRCGHGRHTQTGIAIHIFRTHELHNNNDDYRLTDLEQTQNPPPLTITEWP